MLRASLFLADRDTDGPSPCRNSEEDFVRHEQARRPADAESRGAHTRQVWSNRASGRVHQSRDQVSECVVVDRGAELVADEDQRSEDDEILDRVSVREDGAMGPRGLGDAHVFVVVVP